MFRKSVSLGLICATVAWPAAGAQESIRGRVRSHDGNSVHVCFDRDFVPAAGAEFLVVRHTVSNQPKSVSTLRSADVGRVRIVAMGNDGCADATLLSGSARALDWLAVADS